LASVKEENMKTKKANAPMSPDGDRFIFISEAVAISGFSAPTIKRYLAEGLLTRYKVGKKRTVLKLSEVNALVRKA
jgi:hypothetical protein